MKYIFYNMIYYEDNHSYFYIISIYYIIINI